MFSIEKVGTELAAREDDLSEWAASRTEGLVLPAQPGDLTALRQVAAWVQGHGYTPSGVSDFLDAADFYLVGQALSLGYTVVTRDKPENSLNRVKIPKRARSLRAGDTRGRAGSRRPDRSASPRWRHRCVVSAAAGRPNR